MPVWCQRLNFVSRTLKSQRIALTRQWLQMRSLRTYLHHIPLPVMPVLRRFLFALTVRKFQAWKLTLPTVRPSTLDPRARLAGLIGEVL